MITDADREYLIALCEVRVASLTAEARSRGYVNSACALWEAVSYARSIIKKLKEEVEANQ